MRQQKIPRRSEAFSLYPHLMSMLRVELVELRALFQKFSSSVASALRRQQPQSAVVAVACPVADLNPSRGIEHKTPKACGFDGCLRTGKRLVTSLPEVFGENCHSRSVRLVVRDRLHNARDEHVKLARWAEFSGDPLEFGLHRLRLRIYDEHYLKPR
jgi:hypothetical protein